MRSVLVIALTILATPAVAHASLSTVPFVGCPSDGQQGPQPPPKKGKAPRVPAKAAAKLAFYSTVELGVLAPRGWHCIGLSGSNGSFLIVTPERHKAEEFFQDSPADIRGTAVQISVSWGGTSGRLSVMPAIVRYFPHYQPFVQSMGEMDVDFDALSARPYKTDLITEHTANYLRFTTPAGKQGEGTNSRLLPSRLPIQGCRKIVGPIEEPDLIGVDVRLTQDQNYLAEMILSEGAE